MKDKLLLKTIIICATAIICIIIASYTYYETNRYKVAGENGAYIIDKYNGKSYDSEGKVDDYFRNKP